MGERERFLQYMDLIPFAIRWGGDTEKSWITVKPSKINFCIIVQLAERHKLLQQ